MKQLKTCGSAQILILLAVFLAGCGNKGPLTLPESTDIEAEPSSEQPTAVVEDKKEQKP